MLVGGSIVLLQARRDAWTTAKQASQNLRFALDRDIARNLKVFDLSLQGVIRALATPGIADASAEVRRLALFDSAVTAEDLGALRVLDAEGRVLEDSTSPAPNGDDLSPGESFHARPDRRDDGLAVSRIDRDVTADSDLTLSLTRRIPMPDGRIVEGVLRLALFRDLFENLNLGPRGTITVFRDDGRVLYRHPRLADTIDRDLSGSEEFRHFAERDHGSLVSRSQLDGVRRLYTFGRVAGFPIILAVGRATNDIYAAWWRRTLIGAPFRLILCACAVASTLLFSREIRRRQAAEAALRVAMNELSALATTDGLTGIANRRAFDTRLDGEWRRILRARAPIAVLTIDVDHFKSFNDRYGHPRGDEALRAVATCLREVARRPSDLAARTGGEEFSVVLPDTDLAGALGVAGQIRSAVEALDLTHEESATGRLTVSIGVAVARPMGGDLCQDLLQAADAALYAAKRAGRNQVCASQPVPVPALGDLLSQPGV